MSVTSTDYFKINGISSHNYGLYVDTPPMAAMSEQKYNVIEIPDREESLYYTRDVFNDLTINIKCYSFEKDFDIQRVYAWLRFAETLILGGDDISFYRIKKVNGITPNYQGHGKNLITISFVVSPFKYRQSDGKSSYTSKTFSISNTGNYWCRPEYKIYGSGDITLTITNGTDTQTLTIYDVDGNCVVDTERLIAYKELSTGNALLHTSGIMPILRVGTNNASLTGTVTKVTIKRNLRDV